MLNEEDFVSVEQAAEILGITSRRVRQICLQGRLGKKILGRYLIKRSDLLWFSRRNRQAGNPNWRKSEKRVDLWDY